MNAVFAFESRSPVIPATRFSLDVGTFVLGRSSKCDLMVKHETVSRRHAEIILTRQMTAVRDLGSRNGTFIEKKRVLTGEIGMGQHVRFGSVTYLLTLIQPGEDGADSERQTAKCGRSNLSADSSHAILSRAQCRVLDLVLQGLGEKKIAAQLSLSATTIHNHIHALYRGCKVHSRSELLVRVLAKNGPPAETAT